MTRDAPAFTLHGARWWTRPGADAHEVARTLERAFAALESGTAANTKTGRRKALYPLHLLGDARTAAPDFLLKSNTYPARSALTRLFRASKAVHELRLALALAARGLASPLPLAAGEERRAGRLVRCWLLVPFVPGSRDLLALVRSEALGRRERRPLARALGQVSRSAHDAGLYQDDFAPNNLLIGPAPARAIWWIDFERARIRRRAVSDAERRWMLAKLERALPEASAAERLCFLLGYTRGDRAAARAWWRALEVEAARLAVRDVQRMGRTATRPGRRFRPVVACGWRGHARRETTDTMLDALAQLPAARGEGRTRTIALGPAACALERTALGARAARAAWSRSIALALRGLAAAPSALLIRDGVARLRFERAPTPAEAWRQPAAERALGRLLVRLLALGELADDADLQAFALVEGAQTPRAVLLDPHAFQLQRRARAPSLPAVRRARDVAARLLSEPRSDPRRASGDVGVPGGPAG